ncbi:CopG family transcriptional regulator [Methylibium rhizosphaerae]|uniref:ribbon-helix-helix domain-containing protein n=1 Tax=Methylibium rhizosphaerae TaxID=2570323 RepID=UPI001125B392|nr:CopG family transcriptional regulator [Methylibium rhizosphaerae]
MPKKVIGGAPKERSDRAVSTPRRSGVRPTSVHLTAEESAALMSEAKRRNVSRSALIRQAIQRLLGGEAGVAPPSLGIADGIYPSTIHDDVVTLANLVVGLGYVVETLEGRISRHRRAEARAQLADAIEQIQRIAGRSVA